MIHPTDLAALLRDRARWPEGFEWDFYSCSTCAMGLARKTWEPDKDIAPNVESTAKLLGIPEDVANRIFAARPNVNWHCGWNGGRRDIQPEEIAADLEALAAREIFGEFARAG